MKSKGRQFYSGKISNLTINSDFFFPLSSCFAILNDLISLKLSIDLKFTYYPHILLFKNFGRRKDLSSSFI